MTGDAFVRAREAARSLVRKYHIIASEHIDIQALLVLHGVFHLSGDLEGADARLLSDSKGGIVTLRKSMHDTARIRFTLAHELGHFILHRKHGAERACGESEFLQWYRKSDQEPEANVFAAELLMPETLFRASCQGRRPGVQSVMALAREYQTSLTASAYRYAEIGNHPCALVASRNGVVAWFACSEDFGMRVLSVGAPVATSTGPGEFFQKGTMPPEQPEPTQPEWWLTGGELDKGALLYENSFAIPSFETVLSLIWVDGAQLDQDSE